MALCSCDLKMKQRTQIALYVAAFGLGVAVLLSASAIGLNLLDRNAPEWVIALHRSLVQLSMTGVVFTVVSAVLFIFVYFGLILLPSAILAKVMDYALACMFGCALAIAMCVTAAQFEANRNPSGNHAAAFFQAAASAEKSARSSGDRIVMWGPLMDLHIMGALLTSAEYYVDHIADFLMPGILLPPMFLYIWKRRKSK